MPLTKYLQEKAGAAAIFVTDLDKVLGGEIHQHRQLQGSESANFCEVGHTALIRQREKILMLWSLRPYCSAL